MPKIHINDKGEPGKCSAAPYNCPFASENDHFASADEARANYEAKNAENVIASHRRETRDSRKSIFSRLMGNKSEEGNPNKPSLPELGSENYYIEAGFAHSRELQDIIVHEEQKDGRQIHDLRENFANKYVDRVNRLAQTSSTTPEDFNNLAQSFGVTLELVKQDSELIPWENFQARRINKAQQKMLTYICESLRKIANDETPGSPPR